MVVLAVDVALLGGLAAIDKAKGRDIIDLPWWAWLLLAAPALQLIVLLLAVPLAELSPGPVRNAGVALLGLGETLYRRGAQRPPAHFNDVSQAPETQHGRRSRCRPGARYTGSGRICGC